MRSLIIITFTLLTGCMASMPNTIDSATSSFDGSRQITMQPGFVYTSDDFSSWGYFKLGLTWLSKHEDKIIITAEIPNAITSINSDKGLRFNIDGQITTISSAQIFTDFDVDRIQSTTYKSSTKLFIVEKSLLDKILSASDVKVRLHTNEGYLDGDLLADKPSAAIRGFRDFSTKL